MSNQRFLVIQTSFIGDVILATAVVEKLHEYFPNATIDFLLRKGNEGLLNKHPFLNEVLIWDKKSGKYRNLSRLIGKIRKNNYDSVINLQRFTATGLITVLSRAKYKAGFDKNPLSMLFTHVAKHVLGGMHEVERNQQLISSITDENPARPRLYPPPEDIEKTHVWKYDPYICIAPTSVWFTKQLPAEKWLELIDYTSPRLKIYLLGAPEDAHACEAIRNAAKHPKVENLAGKLTLLQSAALMRDAKMNYMNDSAPMHLASAMNAPCRAVYCSTVPDFGFGPLSDDSAIIETPLDLYCRPCGLHGWKECPEGHFNCALTIDMRREDVAM